MCFLINLTATAQWDTSLIVVALYGETIQSCIYQQMEEKKTYSTLKIPLPLPPSVRICNP